MNFPRDFGGYFPTNNNYIYRNFIRKNHGILSIPIWALLGKFPEINHSYTNGNSLNSFHDVLYFDK